MQHSPNEQLMARKAAATPRGVGVMGSFFVDRAENAELWDIEGRRYIDFAGGIAVLNTGHRHPKVQAAVTAQMQRFMHTCYQVVPYEGYIALAEKLNALTPGSHAKKTALFSTGAEAIENAVKIARAYTCTRIHLGYRVIQTAGGTNHGNRSIFHGIKLSQAAGFIAGGNQKHIGAGQNPSGQFVVKALNECELIFVGFTGPLKPLLHYPIAGSQNDQPNLQGFNQLAQYRNDQINPFLNVQPGYNADERTFHQTLVQLTCLNQGGFAEAFSGQIVWRVACGNGRIRLRAPKLIIDTVQETEHGSFPVA